MSEREDQGTGASPAEVTREAVDPAPTIDSESPQTPQSSVPVETLAAEATTPDAAPTQAASGEAAESRAAEPAGDTATGTDPPKDDGAAAKDRKPRRRNRTLARAWRAGRPVQGTIERVIKGGYEVRVGGARGFCPHSQIDLHRDDDPEARVGKTYPFRVTQLRRGGEDVVLSRRALLEDERADDAKAVRMTLEEGAVMQGRVAGMAQFGAFVDLGAGVMGLAHISELSHTRVAKVEDALEKGQAVRVKILKIRDDGRISLSVRQAREDPWRQAAERFAPGTVHSGLVRRVADFGAFVELEKGIEALAPASELPPSASGWRDDLQPGTTKDWYVLSVDPAERRISVTLPGERADAEPVVANQQREGNVQRIERYGIFVWLGPGQVGLMPRAWTGVPTDVDLRKRFKIGDAIDVRVVEISDGGRRIRLAKPGVDIDAKPERSAPRTPPPPQIEQASFGTSLADKLRAALGQPPED